jgi:ribosomal protein S18 acetylase RimI-like enzyme
MNQSCEFVAQVRITIRSAQETDLPALEWWGWHSEHRNIIRSVFEQSLHGDSIMLVADSDRFPVGQVWIDLTRKRQESVGILWAVRVIPGLRGCGIGSRLVACAEQSLEDLGYETAKITVEYENSEVKEFYERMGYQVVGSERDERTYSDPAGTEKTLISEQWILRKLLRKRLWGVGA